LKLKIQKTASTRNLLVLIKYINAKISTKLLNLINDLLTLTLTPKLSPKPNVIQTLNMRG